MIKPRNNWIVLRLIESQTRKVGTLVIPALKDEFTEAEVIAVGPGVVSAGGARPDTFDLRVGQCVFVQHKKKLQGGVSVYAGVPYRQGGNSYFLYDETSIVGIVSETCASDETYTDLNVGGLVTPAPRELIH